MTIKTEPTEVSQQYAAAYAAHYKGRNLSLALELYQKLMESHPSAQESGYARMQIQNIVNAVVPKEELFKAQIELLRVHLATL